MIIFLLIVITLLLMGTYGKLKEIQEELEGIKTKINKK